MSLVHGIDVGHGHEQEQEQLCVLQYVVPNGLFGRVQVTVPAVDDGNHGPHYSGSQDNGLGLAQMGEFFCHDQGVRDHEYDQCREADSMEGEVNESARRRGGPCLA